MAKRPFFTQRQTDVVDEKRTGKSQREIAAALGISPAAVKQRLRRARQRAHVRYGRALAGPSGPPVKFKPFRLLATDHV